MKLSELWLNEWVNSALSREEKRSLLTMAGLEVESILPITEKFTQVVTGEILKAEKHPEADRLQVCQVKINEEDEVLTIVCGAPNARSGLKVAVALVGAVLPNNFKISKSKIRGITSYGMLCSYKELGLDVDSAGIIELTSETPIGIDVWEFLQLNDFIWDVSITPNRGDCLSIQGLAKELATLTESTLTPVAIDEIAPRHQDALTITIQNEDACGSYIGRIIKKVNLAVEAPIWIKERLRRSGTRSINIIVDIMNYVMYELGQPMHAFDLSKIEENIIVRYAKNGETLKLLDGQTVQLNPQSLIIADKTKPLAIGGVMGGLESGVNSSTQDIFLESAYFNPITIAASCRYYNLHSESSYRFERGIDPTLQTRAIERATHLILALAGGEPGPITQMINEQYLPPIRVLSLRSHRLEKILGFKIPSEVITTILERLNFEVTTLVEGWKVTVPRVRSDITSEIDLIEEVIRIYGYDKLPLKHPSGTFQIHAAPETQISSLNTRNVLNNLGFTEVITYSFIDETLQKQFDPDSPPKRLKNPITSDMCVMRTNLWPGLIKTFLFNAHRQLSDIKIFETGLRFKPNGKKYDQEKVLSGLWSGKFLPEQWAEKQRKVDFFDIKGVIENLMSLTKNDFKFENANHPALHPGQTAVILKNGHNVGIFGALHPQLALALDIIEPTFMFEILQNSIECANLAQYKEVSKFPSLRRDISIFVDQTVPAQVIQDTIQEVGGDLLKDVQVFDVYQGAGNTTESKSIALALTLQHNSRTLVDEEVTHVIERIIVALNERFAAELRG